MADAIYEGINDHEARRHPLCAVSEATSDAATRPDGRIPEAVLDTMLRLLENLQSRDFAIFLLARIFDYPEDLVIREIAAHDADVADSRDGLARA